MSEPSYLSCDAIDEQVKRGGIVIDPYFPHLLSGQSLMNNASYNSTLGEWYWRRRFQTPETAKGNDKPVNPYDPATPTAIFRLYRAEAATIALPDYTEDEYPGIPPNALVIVIRRGEYILGHTLERIGGTMAPDGRCFLAEMKARSTTGRLGLEACRCAGLGDSGYCSRWTAEIQNNTDQDIVLIVGTPIMQFRFFEITRLSSREHLYGADEIRDGYQQGTGMIEPSKWKPEMLLPRPLKVFEPIIAKLGLEVKPA